MALYVDEDVIGLEVAMDVVELMNRLNCKNLGVRNSEVLIVPYKIELPLRKGCPFP